MAKRAAALASVDIDVAQDAKKAKLVLDPKVSARVQKALVNPTSFENCVEGFVNSSLLFLQHMDHSQYFKEPDRDEDLWFLVDQATGEVREPTLADITTFFKNKPMMHGGIEFAQDYSGLLRTLTEKIPFQALTEKFGSSDDHTEVFSDDQVFVAGATGLAIVSMSTGDILDFVPLKLADQFSTKFNIVSQAVEVAPGTVVALMHFNKMPGFRHVLVSYDLADRTSRVIWHGDTLVNGFNANMIPLPKLNWLLCDDEKGLCVRHASTGQLLKRLLTPDGDDIKSYSEQQIGLVDEKMILVVDPENESAHRAYAFDLPSLELRADVDAKIDAAYEDKNLWFQGRKADSQVTGIFGIGVTEDGRKAKFALAHFGCVNFVEL